MIIVVKVPFVKYFVTPKVKRAIQARNRAYKKGQASVYRYLRNHVKKEIRGAKKKFYKENIETSSNSQKWWKKINELMGRNKTSSAINVNDPNSTITMNEKAIADYINSFFTSLTEEFSPLATKWLENNIDEQLPRIFKESVAVE